MIILLRLEYGFINNKECAVKGEINITTIILPNLIGIILLVLLAVGNRWRMKKRSEETACLNTIIVLALVSCILDPLLFAMDGRPGAGVRILLSAGNAWLYAANMFTALAWLIFVGHHLNGGLNRLHYIIIIAVAAAAFLLLVLNFFVPVAFSLDKNNVYSRLGLYWLYLGLDVAYVLDSIILYIVARHRGGSLKLFPIGAFIAPIAIGMIVQTLWYGVSLIWPCVAVAIAGLLTSLQNEIIFIDSLTGIYNRAYLDNFLKNLYRSEKMSITGIMIDANGFKEINDNFGHSTGDAALTTIARLLWTAVGDTGTVLRYAGDEFVVLLNTHDEKKTAECLERIRKSVDKLNNSGREQYSISLAMGCSRFDPSGMTFDDFIDEIDKRMYEDKANFYLEHPEYNRRRNA